MHRTTTKIRRIGDALVGCAGSGTLAEAVMSWIDAGADPAKYPALQADKDEYSNVLVIKRGLVVEYTRTAYPVVYEDRFLALGCGRDFAIAAMHLGKTAREAVEIACLFDSGCGNGIDTLTLAE